MSLKFSSKTLKKLTTLLTLIFLGYLFSTILPPKGLDQEQWTLLIVFISTIVALILNLLPMGVIMLASTLICVLTDIINIEKALNGFSSNVVWLVIMAFFIAKAIIKSNLAKRVSYYIISYMGNSILGLSYSLILTEFLLSPTIPSATARSGGLVFPIAKSMSDQFHENNNVRPFLMQSCFQANVICSAMFLTAMAGNPLIMQIAGKLGVSMTWKLWALGGIIPGVINLLFIPLFLYKIIKPKSENKQTIILAKKALASMGSITKNEIIVACVFILLITMWIFSEQLNIHSTTTAIAGFLILILTKVISWEDAITESGAWNTFIWFGLFITLSNSLSASGITEWIGHNAQNLFTSLNPTFALPLCIIVFFYLHYFFASITVFASVLYGTFFFILIYLNISPFLSAMMLAYLSNISGGLSHYTISSAPIFFTGSKLTLKKWLRLCLLASSANLLIWTTIGLSWWKFIGWW